MSYYCRIIGGDKYNGDVMNCFKVTKDMIKALNIQKLRLFFIKGVTVMYKDGKLTYDFDGLNKSIEGSQILRELALPGEKGTWINVAGTVYVDWKNDRIGLEDIFNEYGYFLDTHINLKITGDIRTQIIAEEGNIIEIEGQVDDYDSTYRTEDYDNYCNKRRLTNIKFVKKYTE